MEGQATIHPLLCSFSLPGVPELMPQRQVSRIRFPPWLSALFCLDSPEGWWQRKGWGCFSFPVRASPTGAHSSGLHRREFCLHLASELIQRVTGRISTEDSFVYQGEIQKSLKLFTAGWKNNTKNKHCADRYPDGFCRQILTLFAQLSLININVSSQDVISKIYKAPNDEVFREMGVIMPSRTPSRLWLNWIYMAGQNGSNNWCRWQRGEWGKRCNTLGNWRILREFHRIPAVSHCQNRLLEVRKRQITYTVGEARSITFRPNT